MSAEDRQLPSGFPWPNPEVPAALVPCEHGREQKGEFAAFVNPLVPSCPQHKLGSTVAFWYPVTTALADER